MSNSIFQNVIVQLKEATDRVFGVIDSDGCVVSSTDVSLLGERWAEAALKVAGSSDTVVFAQKSFKALGGSSNHFEYAAFCQLARRPEVDLT